jgi:hypothetical protein
MVANVQLKRYGKLHYIRHFSGKITARRTGAIEFKHLAGKRQKSIYIKFAQQHNIKGYIKKGSDYLGSKNMNGRYMYAVDMDGNIIIGTKRLRMSHSTLIGGKNP